MRRSDVSVDALISLARDAGAAILDHYAKQDLTAARLADKQDGSPLTQADLAAHQVIAAGLSGLLPDCPLVSEEGSLVPAGHALTQGRFWLVDPLDGTKEFLNRNGEFTVNIALIEHRVPVLGVVYAPALGLLYWGGNGIGAWRQQDAAATPVRIRVASPPAAGSPWRVVASKSHRDAATDAFIAALGSSECEAIGSSLKFCRVAEGSAHVYPRLGPTHEWDTAAAHAVLLAAGGDVVTLDGAPLRYGHPGVLNPHFIATGVPFEGLPRAARAE